MSTLGWREDALMARAALYLLMVATARPDLPRVESWQRAHVEVTTVMERGYPGERMSDPEWEDLDWPEGTDGWTADQIKLVGYRCHAAIKGEVAI